MTTDVAAAVGRILFIQAAVLAVIFLGGWALFGWQVGRSAGYGGLVAWIPNAYFALKICRDRGKEPQRIMRGFYVGEAVKLILTAGLFVLVFRLPEILFIPLFASFVAVLGVFWIALLLDKNM